MVTSEDLLKLKIELTDEQRKTKHETNNAIQKYISSLDEYKTNQALLQQTQTSMKEDIKEIKTEIKEGFKEIKQAFENLPTHFATKEEHKSNSTRIDKIEKWVWWLIALIWTAIVWAILKLILWWWNL